MNTLLFLLLFTSPTQDIPQDKRVYVQLVNQCKVPVLFVCARTFDQVGYSQKIYPGKTFRAHLILGHVVKYSPSDQDGFTRLDTVRRTGQTFTTCIKKAPKI